MANYKKNFGLSGEGNGSCLDVVIDAANDTTTSAGAGYTSADTVSVLLPAGTLLLGAIVRTDAVWTSTISVGITGATTALISSGTPSATVGNTIAGIPSAVCAANDTATYLVVTLNATNTTGKLKIKVPLFIMNPGNFSYSV